METLVRKVQVTGIHLQGPKAAIFRAAWSRVLSMKIADYWFHDMMEILIFNVDFGVKLLFTYKISVIFPVCGTLHGMVSQHGV